MLGLSRASLLLRVRTRSALQAEFSRLRRLHNACHS